MMTMDDIFEGLNLDVNFVDTYDVLHFRGIFDPELEATEDLNRPIAMELDFIAIRDVSVPIPEVEAPAFVETTDNDAKKKRSLAAVLENDLTAVPSNCKKNKSYVPIPGPSKFKMSKIKMFVDALEELPEAPLNFKKSWARFVYYNHSCVKFSKITRLGINYIKIDVYWDKFNQICHPSYHAKNFVERMKTENFARFGLETWIKRYEDANVSSWYI